MLVAAYYVASAFTALSTCLVIARQKKDTAAGIADVIIVLINGGIIALLLIGASNV